MSKKTRSDVSVKQIQYFALGWKHCCIVGLVKPK